MQTTVIGLGAMGAGIAANLHRAGLLAGAWNRTPERGSAAAGRLGFPLSDSLDDAVAGCGLVVTSVSADPDLLEVTGRLRPLLQPGTILLDTSTVAIDTVRRISADCRAANLHFIDGPVSGGREGAERGTLVMMAGGDADVLERIRPALDAFTGKVALMGEVGSGQATKAVNQIMAAGINQAVTEALAFGAEQQLDLAQVIDLLAGGAAGSWYLGHRAPSMVRETYEPGFRLTLHHKDLKICQQMAAGRGVKLPVVEMTLLHYERLMQAGHGDEDISALYRLKRALFTDTEH